MQNLPRASRIWRVPFVRTIWCSRSYSSGLSDPGSPRPMTTLSFPAHRLIRVNNEDGLILAATGTHIQTIQIGAGQPLSCWPRDDAEISSEPESIEEGRPSKRMKLDNITKPSWCHDTSEASEASIDIKVEGRARQKGERRKPKIPNMSLPHVSHLVTTSDGSHAIAITAEDKAVRVFKISRSGRLRQLSSRCMPKKSCAITLSPDEKTILTADKFGDVYALPLHPTADYQPKTKLTQVEKDFRPSASELTVHTKGNLEALRQQLSQKQKHAKKEGPAFEHQLLLGHVSLLTDLTTATGNVDGRPRPFLLTSDRDEHIRVSRGLPQTHIIHSYCSGHTEFVSKLCIIPWDQKVLVAGNGEPSLRVYDWQTGQEYSRFDLLEHFSSQFATLVFADRSAERLAVAGVWALSSKGDVLQTKEWSHQHLRVILVSLEALPVLLVMNLSGYDLRHVQTVRLDGNVLDVLFVPEHNAVAVSIDTVHEPGSYTVYREGATSGQSAQFFNLKYAQMEAGTSNEEVTHLQPCANLSLALDSIPVDSLSIQPGAAESAGKPKNNERMYSPLGELIYGLENLRKRRGKVTAEEDEAAQEEDVDSEGAAAIGW